MYSGVPNKWGGHNNCPPNVFSKNLVTVPLLKPCNMGTMEKSKKNPIVPPSIRYSRVSSISQNLDELD